MTPLSMLPSSSPISPLDPNFGSPLKLSIASPPKDDSPSPRGGLPAEPIVASSARQVGDAPGLARVALAARDDGIDAASRPVEAVRDSALELLLSRNNRAVKVVQREGKGEAAQAARDPVLDGLCLPLRELESRATMIFEKACLSDRKHASGWQLRSEVDVSDESGEDAWFAVTVQGVASPEALTLRCESKMPIPHSDYDEYCVGMSLRGSSLYDIPAVLVPLARRGASRCPPKLVRVVAELGIFSQMLAKLDRNAFGKWGMPVALVGADIHLEQDDCERERTDLRLVGVACAAERTLRCAANFPTADLCRLVPGEVEVANGRIYFDVPARDLCHRQYGRSAGGFQPPAPAHAPARKPPAWLRPANPILDAICPGLRSSASRTSSAALDLEPIDADAASQFLSAAKKRLNELRNQSFNEPAAVAGWGARASFERADLRFWKVHSADDLQLLCVAALPLPQLEDAGLLTRMPQGEQAGVVYRVYAHVLCRREPAA